MKLVVYIGPQNLALFLETGKLVLYEHNFQPFKGLIRIELDREEYDIKVNENDTISISIPDWED